MTLALIFTLDYELFGDGSGNVKREQIIPTNQLLDIFDQYSAKLTIFFEYGQFLGYQKFASNNKQLAIDNELIKLQLIDAIKRGHDVQLHYHPTWHDVEYRNDSFVLNEDVFDISMLNELEIEKILTDGKNFLETLLTPHDDNYECNSFRAGAWSMKDAKKVLDILKKCGFKADSSVAPNAFFKSSYGDFDYRNSPKEYGYWFIKDDLLTSVSEKYLVELPIYTKKARLAFIKYYNPHYLGIKKIVSKFYKTKVSEKNLSFFNKILKIISRNYYMADFNAFDENELLSMINQVKTTNSNELIPVVLIAHSKTSYFNDRLHFLFSNLNDKKNVQYLNMRTFVKEIL